MIKEKVGEVSKDEKYIILRLHDKKKALEEVAKTLNNEWITQKRKEALKKKIEIEYSHAQNEIDEWWVKKSQKYLWKKIKSGKWTIDFHTNEIFLEEL